MPMSGCVLPPRKGAERSSDEGEGTPLIDVMTRQREDSIASSLKARTHLDPPCEGLEGYEL